MNWLKGIREERKMSQRNLAKRAGVSFRTLQLVESGRWDPKLSTVQKFLSALGYPDDLVEGKIRETVQEGRDTVVAVTERIAGNESSWKIWLFNFIDRFRANPSEFLIAKPPSSAASEKIRALAASTVEALCRSLNRTPPDWCAGIPSLKEPWFPSETENLKASALLESPVDFRRRNIFVLGNFLERA
ncbi:MAG TPA: helix-turn-helix transcriptional regulator [bacterium]|nr:helix-turn-helix transcriptional regulator [bacterium]